MFFSDQNSSRLDKFRYELKIPLERAQLAEFNQYLRQLGLYSTSPYPGRQINSVYFDSQSFDDYVDNISGIADRTKTRLRWYNDDISRLTLEKKIKRNKASYKELLKLDNPNLNDPRTRKGVQKIIENRKISKIEFHWEIYFRFLRSSIRENTSYWKKT